ncbi:MAG: alpha/beta hydrolase [Acidobacteria bacterium]|nr:alpha/beta hydrolase [Acidobacteriota bacterium]
MGNPFVLALKPAWRAWAAPLATALLIGTGIVATAVLFEDSFIYFPLKYPDGWREIGHTGADDTTTGARIEECWFTASDGVRLHGWFCEARQGPGGPPDPHTDPMVLLWFHGNAGNVTHRYEMIVALLQLPVRVFIIDYRGYGKSEGSPSEQGLYRDGRAAWDYLTAARAVAPEQIILFGKSLGAAVAVDLATKVQPAGLIVQSGFTSVPDMAAALLPFIPRFVLRTKMNSLEKIHDVRCPKLFIHSPADEVVPYRLGRRLFAAASEPKEFYEVAGAPHNETYQVGGREYLDALQKFVRSCSPGRKAGAGGRAAPASR